LDDKVIDIIDTRI